MRITMIGTGYVGLVSGVCFSDFGHDVICVDKDPRKIELLQDGQVPIYEPGLGSLMARNVEAGRLTFTTDLAAAVDGADAIFIAVGTPTRRGDGHADLTYVEAASREVAQALTGYSRGGHQIHRACRHQSQVSKQAVRQGQSGKPNSTSPPTRNFCARARRLTISCAPTGWLSASQKRPRRASDGRDLPPAVPARLPDRDHRSGKRGDDQIRRQRLSGHQDHLRERNCCACAKKWAPM